MKCPSCGGPDAYLGFSSIDCPNNKCKHFNNSKGSITIAPPVPIAPTPPISPPIAGQGISPLPIRPQPPSGAAGNPPAGNTQPNLATQLGVSILSKLPKVNSVLLTFKGFGDPGFADKRIEFYFTLPGSVKQICTLSNSLRYYVDGIDADNITSYTTHWMCTQDGVQPTDQYSLDAIIYP